MPSRENQVVLSTLHAFKNQCGSVAFPHSPLSLPDSFITRGNIAVDIQSVRANLPLVNAYLQAGLDALADATRMAIFQKLSNGPIAVNELASTMPVTRPAVSQHLKVLKDAGLVTDIKAGTRRLYQLDPQGVARLRFHFDQMWSKALSSFQQVVEEDTTPRGHHGKPWRRTRSKSV
jgi:DNA-binding transcriptional ArsR family regulator